MGSSTSKAVRTASEAVRKYPSRIPPQSTSPRSTNAPSARPPIGDSQGPTVHPRTDASGSRDEAITRDASDPDLVFNARLQQLGVVQPFPTMSNSSTFNSSPKSKATTTSSTPFQPSASTPGQSIFPSPATNPAISLLTARSRLSQEAQEEFESLGRNGAPGRLFLDVVTIRQALMMRDELGTEEGEIERKLGLRKGVVRRLGAKGVVSSAGA